MNLKYEIKIYERNKTTTLEPNVLSDTIKLDESLDSGLMVLPRLTRKEQFKRFSIVNIKVIDNDELETIINIDYLVYATESRIIGKGKKLYYEHTLGLIEPIKWFEKFQCGTLTFTQPLDDGNIKTLYNVVDRLRDLVPFVDNDSRSGTRLFQIDTELKARLVDYGKAPQIYLEQKNLREALIQIFQVINAIPRIRYDETDKLWYLTADYVNEKRKLIDISTDIIDYKMENDGENYGQTAELFQENALPDQEQDFTNVFANSITEYVSLRSDEIIVGESNQKLKLDYPMGELKSIKLLTLNNEEIDLTPYCFEKKVYDTLEYDTEDDDITGTKSRAFFWSYKSDIIDGLFLGYGNVFKTTAIRNILNYLNEIVFDDYYIFKIEYIPFIENMRSKIYRIDREPYELTENMFDSESTVRLNQQERLNDLFSATKNVYGEIQRIGVDTISFSKKHYDIHRYDETDHPNGIYAIGDYTSNNFIITKVERIFYRKFAIARYEATNNFNRIAQFIQVDKEFRPYNIALTGNDIALKRDVLIPLGFIEVDIEEKENELNTQIRDNFMQVFNWQGVFKLPFTTSVFVSGRTPSLEYSFGKPNAVSKPIQLLTEKNTFKYRLSFIDTKLAGKKRLDRLDTIDTNLRNSNKQLATNYTEENGEFSFGKVVLKEKLWDEVVSDNSYPLNDDEIYFVKYYMSLLLPSVFHESITKPSNSNQYLYGWYSGVLPNEPTSADASQYLDKIKIYDTYAELEFDGKELDTKFYYAKDTNKIYGYNLDDELIELYGKLLYLENTDGLETKPYYFRKDRSEILGLDLYLPVLPNQNINDNIIIGDYLVKHNPLLFNSNVDSRTLYWYASAKPFNKTQTSKIYSDATQLLPFNLSGINTNNIDIPLTVYDNYSYFALGDGDRNMYLAFNQINVDGTVTTINKVYFNTLESLSKVIISVLYGEIDLAVDMSVLTSILEAFIAQETNLNANMTLVSELLVPFILNGNQDLNAQLNLLSELIEPTIFNGSQDLTVEMNLLDEFIEPTIFNGEQDLNVDLSLATQFIEPYVLNGTQEINADMELITQIILPINISGVNRELNTSLSLNTTTVIKGWEYVSTSGTEPTTSGYIDGGIDNTINTSSDLPSESANNYNYGDFVYYKNTNSNLWFTYKVIEVII